MIRLNPKEMAKQSNYEISEAQVTAIQYFWDKAKPKGWKYTKEVRKESDGTLIVKLRHGRNHHWLRISQDGELSFLPVTMVGMF